MAPIVSEEYKERKRQEILQSAHACFAKKGFEASTVDDIVAQSGLSKGAIYNYFKSKDEIYLALMDGQTRESGTKFAKAIAERSTALEKLDFLVDAYLGNDPNDAENKDEALVHFEFRLYSTRNPELKKTLTERYKNFFVTLLAGIIEEGQGSGEFDIHLDPATYADIFWAMVNGVTLQATILDGYRYKNTLKEMQAMFVEKLRA
ncbi:TetR/AcrR family transcriptional regulator [Mesobacillus sp. AQ2]|jgi:AcrR family transcriptional regulator|uniref:TetR/AcrR family transcriptional regulator n=1 Tax=Bacillaceae TaxID=186817 RepID=UPI0011A494C7|nr:MULTISPECIES: TetR/AcrR family transcriptional regulator [Bacillaceae]MCM3124777.1 TetR/AcrR family transcriptional regulator [Mesobacillus sp. MER 33]MCM3232914.1 TetR/AcrR family transcriptional regulator [Mesobacillus sp. MER 48]WHX41998.1 TetR/AcrR family transcriptional regulator [Mesobacillus sp. AQ2]